MKAIIWGAGNVGKAVAFSLNRGWEIVCFVDRSEQKIGTVFCGREVKTPQALVTEVYDVLIIANTHGKDIRREAAELAPDTPVIDFLSEGLFDARLCQLYLLRDEIEAHSVPGAVAEAGVYRGDFTVYINAAFKERRLYLFDTFSGFAPPDVEQDKRLALSSAKADLFTDTGEDVVRKKLTSTDAVIFRTGFFPDTAVGLEDETYCFVSIDFDLYNPIKEAILYFYPRLLPGGYIMVHDYHNEDFRGVKKAVDELKGELGFCFFPISDGGGSIVIGR